MLFESFQHIPRIGPAMERRIWEQGICNWGLAGQADSWPSLGVANRVLLSAIDDSQCRLAAGDAKYFAARLPSREQWRMYRDFIDQVVFLDIETTGAFDNDSVTTVVTLSRGELSYFVQGENLQELREFVRQFKVVVTFNGKSFDGPFLKRALDVDLPAAHIDLLYPCRTLGLRGGLKKVERLAGVSRVDALGDVNGADAIRLWHRYRRTNDPKYLTTLLAYNAQDVISLERLAHFLYESLTKSLPIRNKPTLPPLSEVRSVYQPDAQVVDEIRELSACVPLWAMSFRR